jgi:anthranilate phosphoribosyltransferase
MVVHGLDGLDEISLTGLTKITELKDGWIKSYIFDPKSIGLEYVKYEELAGGDVDKNKEICLDILSGNESNKAKLAYLNAGAGFYIYGFANSIKEGYQLALDTAKSGFARNLLNEFIALSKA